MKLRVGLDVDGVLSNFYSTFCRKVGINEKESVKFYDKEIVDNFHIIENDKEFWSNLDILNSADKLDFDFDVYITSLPEKLLESRLKWLKDNGYPNKPVILSDEKDKDCIKNGIEILIDDKSSTIKKCNEVGIYTIQYKPYYLDTELVGDFIVRDFSSIKEIIKYINIKNKI